MKGLPSRNGTGRVVLQLAFGLMTLSLPALAAEAPSGENLLDARLKLLVRARREAESAGADARAMGGSQRVSRVRALLDRARARQADALAQAGAAESRLSLLVRYAEDCTALESVGFHLQAQLGRVCTGTLAADRLLELASREGVQFVRSSQMLRALASPAAAPVTRPAGALPGQTNGPSAAVDVLARAASSDSAGDASGAGVLVAFVDTGVDIRHQDFRKPDGTTRIKYLLDLSDPGDRDGDGDLDGTGPYGGTLYTQAQIDAALASGAEIREKDTTGHGTHGLSVAAGDDAVTPGMAPGADLLVVKATREDGTLGFVSTDVINALSFVDQKAQELGLPYVVNLSLGTIVASHDGRSLEEQALDALVGPGRAGKVAVLAAGNSSDNRSSARFRHLGGTAHVGLATTHTLRVPSYTPSPGQGDDRVFLDVWYKGRDKLTLTVTPPGGSPVSASFGSYVDVETPQGNVFIANLGGASLENGDVEALVLIDDWTAVAPAVGEWTLSVRGEEIGDSGEYHAWLADDSALGGVAPYLSGNADNRALVGKPGSAVNGITVGSYARHDPASRFRTSWTDVNGLARTDTTAILGDISDFSSPGKTRDGRVKPELVAPGERVLGAVSKDALPGAAPASIYRYHSFSEADALLTDATPEHGFGLLQGTSFSAPVVAGLAARILSTDPTLDAVQVRNILINSTTTDAFTGAVPNDVWGYGKVDQAVGGGAPLPPDLRITSDVLPNGVLNEAYDRVLTASGGKLPHTWSLASGSLPAGLGLDASGHISGVCTTAGSFDFTVRVSGGPAPAEAAAKQYQILVTTSAPLRVFTGALPPARLGLAYEEVIEAHGGTPPYNWTLAGGDLPPGLALLADGRVQGKADTLGRYTFTARVTDAAAAFVLHSVRLKVTREGAETWEELGAEASAVNQIAIDPNDVRHLLVATDNTADPNQNAVFESADGGESWRTVSINNGFFDAENYHSDQVLWLSFNPIGSVAWAVKHNDYMGGGDVLRYDPAAPQWVKLLSDCGDAAVVESDISGTEYLFCGSKRSFRRSTDQGATWISIGTLCGGSELMGGGVPGFMTISRGNPNYAYVIREGSDTGGVFEYTCRTQDGGATWTEAGRLTDYPFTRYVDVQVSQANPLDVVRGLNRNGPADVERSLDGGTTWTRYPAPISFTILRRAPSNPAVLIIGSSYGGGPYKSTDHGQSWAPLPVKGLSGLKVTAVAFEPSNADAFYLGTDQGLFYTTDGGLTWARKNRTLKHQAFTGLALSPSAPAELLMGTGNGYAYLSRTDGDKWTASSRLSAYDDRMMTPLVSQADPNLFVAWKVSGTSGYPFRGPLLVSEDRGMTWRESLYLEGGCICAGVMSPWDADPNDANTILVGANLVDGKFYRSADRGRTWSAVSPPSPGYTRDVTFAKDVPGRVFARQSDGIFRSEDGGLTWQPLGTAPSVAGLVQPAPSDSRYVYAGSTASVLGPSVYYLDPAVGTWQAAVTAPAQGVLSLTVHWTDPRIAYAGVDHPGTVDGTGGLYKTTDGGRNWSHLPGVLDGFDVISIAIHPTLPGTLFVGTAEGGAFRSTDAGVTFTPLDKFGSVGEVVNVTVKHPSAALVFAGTQGYGVQVSADGGRTFAPRVTGLTNLNVHALTFETGSPTVMYAGTDAGIFKSVDTGNTWAPTAQSAGEVTDIISDSEGVVRRIWATVRGQGVAYSADGGASFALLTNGLVSLDLTSLELEVVGAVRRIWATTRGGDGVVYSDDLGQTWKSAAGTGLTNRNVNDFTHESSAVRRIWGTVRRIWATTDDGVFYSDNDGTSWTELSLGLPSGVPVTSISIDPNTNEAMVSLFSDREGGAYRGANLSGVWTAFNDGLEELKVKKLTNDGGRVVDATTKATTFYAATAGDGAYQAELRTGAGAPQITTSTLFVATLRQPYSQMLTAAAGTPPYRWSVQKGSLPPGLRLDATGLVSGSPSALGGYRFTVQATDTASRTADRELQVAVVAGLPQLSIEDGRAVEGQSGQTPLQLKVTLSRATSETVSVSHGTSAGTAVAGSDYVSTSGTLTFVPGQTVQWVSVPVVGDTAVESDETFFVALSGAQNATIAVAQATAEIVDDDTPGKVARAQLPWHDWFAVDALETPYVGDFDGDGRTDIITFTRQNPLAVGDVYVALSEGTRFGANTKWHDWFAITTDETVVIGDYDGDGKDDIATWLGRTTRQVYVALSTGVGMMHETVWANSIGADPSDVLFAGDVNGDGKQDLVCFGRKAGKVHVSVSTGTSFQPPVVWHEFFAVSTYERPRVGDVNGDGKADSVTFATDSPTAYGDVYVALSDGTKFVDQNGVPNSSTKWHDWFAIRPTEDVRVGDLDGDGREDFFTFLPPPWGQCYTVLSRGTSMAENVEWRELVTPDAKDKAYVGDVNGDGKADVIVFAQGEGKVYVSLAR